MRRWVVLFGLLALVGCGGSGKPLPTFKMQDVSGKSLTNADLQGKVVLIDFWASWCQPCMMAAPILQNLHQEFSARGLVVLGVNVSDPRFDAESIKSYAENKKLTYRFAWQADQFGQDLKVESLPTFVLIDKQGRIRERLDGMPGDLERRMHDRITELLKE